MNFGKRGNLASVETVNPQELYQTIVDASSQDPSRVHSSSTRLEQMSHMLGTIDALQEIAIQRSLPLPIRQQATIQFKNLVSASWRSRRVLPDEHRMRIRARTLGLLDEADDAISQCNKTVIATIARLDFPHNWPDLFDNLIFSVDARLANRHLAGHDEQQDALILLRTLEILNALVKQFASIKMLTGVKLMANIVQTFRDRLFGHYRTLALTLSTTLNFSTILTEKLLQDITITHLSYKILVKIAVWSWQRLDKYSKEEAAAAKTWQAQVFTFSHNYIQTLFGLRKDTVIVLTREGKITQAHRSLRTLTKLVRTCGKYFRRLQQLDASRFVELPQCGDLVLYYWKQVVDATGGPFELIADTNEAVYPTQILVQGMVLFKDSLSQWVPKHRDGTDNPNTLTQEFVQNAAQLLITRFMPLNSMDLESWSADPEGWLNLEDKENDQWEFEIRPCSERVLLNLTNNYSDHIVPLLYEIFKQSAMTPAVDLNTVIQKEAIYCALGRCAHRLKKEIPFDQWLQHTLVVEAKEPVNPSYPIIKRRIAWLIGKWVSEDCASPDNPLIWDILVHLLGNRSPSTDTVVRLTAATALKDCIDIFGFSMSYLLPHLATIIGQLVQLIGEAETLESKRRVDTALNAVIEKTGHQISPFVSMIVEPLPHLWSSAGDDWLFKASLLVTVTKLVEAIKEQSSMLGAVVVPLVQESLSPNSTLHLEEDGLNLWLLALRNTTTIASINGAPALSDLIPRALGLLADNLDLLGTTIDIVESYIFLDPLGVTQIYGTFLFEALTRTIKSHPLPTNLKSLASLICICVQLTPPTAWAPLLHSSGLFAWLLDKIVENETNTLIMTEFIYIFARIALADSQVFSQLISAAAGQLNQKESYLMEGLLDQWWGKFDNMSEPRHRKLTAMGIASFLSTGKMEVLARLPGEIFNLWLDVFGETKEAQNLSDSYAGSDGSSASLKRYWDVDEAPSWFYQNTEGMPEYERRKAVYDNDPVRTIQLSNYIAEKLQATERNSDPVFFKATLAKADPTVLRQIQAELTQ